MGWLIDKTLDFAAFLLIHAAIAGQLFNLAVQLGL